MIDGSPLDAARRQANAASWASLALGVAAGVAFAFGRFGAGAGASFASLAADVLACRLASAAAAGEWMLLRPAVERYVELFSFGGMAFWLRDNVGTLVLALAAVTGSIMVSYASEKAVSLRAARAAGSLVPAPSLIPRAAIAPIVRTGSLAASAALVPVATALAARAGAPEWAGEAPVFLVLALVAIVGNVSALRRLAAVARAFQPARPARAVLSPHDDTPEIAVNVHVPAGDAR